jgi:hypothetical protein
MTTTVRSGMRFTKVFYLATAALAGIVAIVLVRRGTACTVDVCTTASLEAFRVWYWLAAIPALCIVSAALGYLSPSKAWIWGLVPLAAQWVWDVPGSSVGTGNMGPFAHLVVLAMYALSAIPTIIAAEIAAHVSNRKRMTGRPLTSSP